MKLLTFFWLLFCGYFLQAQELQAVVTVNSQQIGGSNQQAYQALERSLKDFINNTSWTGKRLKPFEKIKCTFSLIITERSGNQYKGSLIVQSARPVYQSAYESPILNINDTNFGFEYVENENLVFNERQFSGKNLIDVISFYTYLILGYDADSFQNLGGTPWFEKAQRIARNATGQQNYAGWNSTEGPRVRGALIDEILNQQNNNLRTISYRYHRFGMDLMATNENRAKQEISKQLMGLKTYENNFQMNYPLSLFIDTKKMEIFNVFNGRNTAGINVNDLRNMFNMLSPKDSDEYWNKWK